ncbi:Tat pathway signal sequence domain protein [Streptomyces turgidiscabies Car8]|uniref:Tat pathway signal sequence domain protein n=1 Tax=Streptomyces turgidiscabies (strain Car8) TaxID=698760 RepID=L7F7V7_STRT8|nr:Tat pathway signal sequence domain protein [Streptomyces turgidiscabies Car8]GAQ76757.1 hypothetical protein T45_08561 [Streptomyces turgidiscabies]
MTVGRRIAGQLAGVGAITMVISGTATAEPAGGGAWAETPTGQVSVMSVAQPSPTKTWAAGAEIVGDPESGNISFTPAMYERDLARGGAWKRTALRGADAWDSRINDISTASDGSAFFVGDQGSDGGGVLVGRYVGGAWQLTPGTLPAGTVEASLLSVSSVSGQDAWAVGQGYTEDTFTQIPVVQHWDGRRWRSVQIPGSANWGLHQVVELAPNDVWTVGVDYDTGQSVAVHWDGRRWTRTPTPVFPDSAVLFDVVARSSTDIWAVGWSRDTDKQRPAGMALHWDGVSWTQVPLPAGTFSLQAATLRPNGGLAVVGGNDDAAVGLSWTPAEGWRSLGLPESDPQLPLGVSSVVANGTHLTVGGWHYRSSGNGDTFKSGAILTK